MSTCITNIDTLKTFKPILSTFTKTTIIIMLQSQQVKIDCIE